MNILLFEINPFMAPPVPISLAYLGAYAMAHGFRVRIIALGEGTPFSVYELQRVLKDFKPRIVGFSAYQRNILYVLGLARAIKEMVPEITTVIGGPQATFMPSSALENTAIDIICREEGEVALLHLAQTLREGNSAVALPGCSCKQENGLFDEGPTIAQGGELDLFPSPYLVEGLVNLSQIDEAIMFTSRGCPYDCIFCYTPRAFKHKVRFHSIDRIMEEVQWLVHKGIHKFWFADPSFSIDMKRVDDLMERIIKKSLKLELWLETRADMIDAEMLRKMRAAGVSQIAYGLESAAEKVLSRLKKKISLDSVRKAVRLTHEHGIGVELFSQYGLPGESLEDAMMTLQFVKENNVPLRGNSNAQQTQIYFGTDLCSFPGKYGITPLESQTPPYISIGDQYETASLSAADLRKIRGIWKKDSLDGGKSKVS